MDAADKANEIIERTINRSLTTIKQTQRKISLIECEDCGEPIPEQRRKMIVGCHRCIDCQTIHEKQRKHYRF